MITYENPINSKNWHYTCHKIAKAFKKVCIDDFSDSSYNSFIQISKNVEPKLVDKITNIVSINQNFRPIDIVVF